MKFLIIVLILIFPATAIAHSGALDRYGCHYDISIHNYHCHKGILSGLVFDNREKMLYAMQDGPDAPTQTYDVYGEVISITNGDTVSILVNNRPVRIRLAGIDAPEQNQDYGSQVNKYIGNLILGKKVRANVEDMDNHGCLIGRVYLNNLDVNADLVKNGFAWAHSVNMEDRNLVKLQTNARNNKRGLWASPNPEPPWEWRRTHPH